MRCVWILALAAGCRGLLGIEEAVVIDAALAPDAPASCATWQPHGMDTCAFPPAAPLVLSGQTYTYDTTAAGGTLTGPTGAVLTSTYTFAPADGPAVAVLSIDALSLGAGTTVRVIGMKPLVVLAWSALAIDGTLDASSARGSGRFGAGGGANGDCVDGSTAGQDAQTSPGSGGGGGGGFHGVGGLAGVGGPVIRGGGAGGAMIAPGLRGGCPGAPSGQAGPNSQTAAATTAGGGAGGGALRLLSLGEITVGPTGVVRANGGGGAGAPATSSCGGGGGGAGGYLGFEAPRVQLDGAVAAIGGGGGGGGGPSDAGKDGEDGAAGGGVSSSGCGRHGGDGSGTGLDGSMGEGFSNTCTTTGGGGGGGGGAGYIVVTSDALTMAGTTAPAITPGS